MDEYMKQIANSKEFAIYRYLDKATLKIILMYVKHNLIETYKQTEEEAKNNQIRYAVIKSCIPSDYNYLEFLMNCNYRIDLNTARSVFVDKVNQDKIKCQSCKLKYCIKYLVRNLLYQIALIQKRDNTMISLVKFINVFLDEKENKTYGDKKINFSNIDTVTLMFVHMILDNQFIELKDFNKETNVAKFNILNLTRLENYTYYINKLYAYYSGEYDNELELDVKDFAKNIENPKDEGYIFIYKLAAYYVYLMEVEKIDVIHQLVNYLASKNKDKMSNRSKYFNKIYLNKVDKLSCNNDTKNRIKSLFNYVLNYNYSTPTPFVPINIVMYTEDREMAISISELIGEYMWFFLYLKDSTKYYEYSMNEIISNKNLINNMYVNVVDGRATFKYGILRIMDFQNIIYASDKDQNIILNLLTEKILKNNSRIVTMIYGNKETIKGILDKHPILSENLFNVELNIDELNIDEVYKIVIDKLALTEKLTYEIKEKIYNYIKLSYGSSDIKNTEYAKVLFNKIILNENKTFNSTKKHVLALEDIPNLYNVRDLPQILSELNNMIGLGKIKKQINNLVSLLKFNKKANIDISKFNLHMVFTGNPGTGKTTVARLLSDILYNLGYTKKNKLVEVSAKDLIAEYVGQTAGKTYNVLKSAFGGVLFIDEAYSIVENGSNASFASDCMTTILKVMEDQKDNLIVIFAGYEKQMEDFIKFNPGLKSRIGYKIKFDDYTQQELVDIFKQLLDKNNLKITENALKKVEDIIDASKKIEDFGNARYINQMYQDILIEHSKNVENIDNDNKEDLMTITEDDINTAKLEVKNNTRKIGF